MITIITLLLIIITGLFVRISKSNISIVNYLYVLISGIVTFLFAPIADTLLHYSSDAPISDVVQIIATIEGIYYIVWSISKIIKFYKGIRDNPISIDQIPIISNRAKIIAGILFAIGLISMIFLYSI